MKPSPEPVVNECPPQTAMVLDLETLATTPDAVVLQIGYAIVDLDRLEFRAVRGISLDPMDQMLNKGREVDPETLEWWNTQPLHAKDSVLSNGYTRAVLGRDDYQLDVTGHVLESIPVRVDARDACRELAAAYEAHNCSQIWAGPPHFDLSIIQSLFRCYRVDLPWKHSQIWCLRTFRMVIGFPRNESELPHDATADAEAGARDLIDGLRILRSEPTPAKIKQG